MERARGCQDQGASCIGALSPQIDFLDLPVESLYRYLEIHDLLPRWDVTPWSEKPCIPRMRASTIQLTTANALYSIPPPPQVVPIVPSPKDTPIDVDPTPNMEPAKPNGDAGEPVEGDEASAEAAAEEERIAPPTTRSKTAPSRRQDTPEPLQIKRGVMTLSDVYSARAVLAEKANQHWAKGLGGGQNREGETIVNFLYKNKVGHSEWLWMLGLPTRADTQTAYYASTILSLLRLSEMLLRESLLYLPCICGSFSRTRHTQSVHRRPSLGGGRVKRRQTGGSLLQPPCLTC